MALRSLLLAICTLVILKASECDQTSGRVIVVSTSCPENPLESSAQDPVSGSEKCADINEALESLDSHTTLELRPGTHYLRRAQDERPTSNLHEIIIRGSEGDEGVIFLTCEEYVGLVFVNITGLRISDLTIHGCGLSRELLSVALRSLEELVRIPYHIPAELRVAVLIGACRDVIFNSVTLTNTTGLGLLAVNIMGHSSFENMTISNNIRLSCELEEHLTSTDRDGYKEIGGGAFFVFHDRNATSAQGSLSSSLSQAVQGSGDHNHSEITQDTLLISHSTFSRNAGCSDGAKASTVSGFLHKDDSYLLGGGGGLSVFLTQSTYWVEVTVEASIFHHNDAKEGGGAYIGIVSGVEGSSVNFIGCVFENNGQSSIDAESTIADSACVNGAGLVIKTDLSKHGSLEVHGAHSPELTPIVLVSGTNFSSNTALRHGGGILADSALHAPATLQLGIEHFPTRWILQDCSFDGNRARHGSAGYFHQMDTHQENGMVLLTMRNIHITRSMLHMSSGELAMPLSSSGLDVVNMKVVVQGDFVCKDNAVTALYIRSSVIDVQEGARVLLRSNSGYMGGGIHMEGEFPLIRLARHSSLVLEDNVATIKGGGVYIATSTSHPQVLRNSFLSYSSCFIYPPAIGNFPYHFNLSRKLSQVNFTNNVAPIGGEVYGSTLASCPWTNSLRDSEKSVYQALHDESGFITFDGYSNSATKISTPAVKMTANVDSRVKTDGNHITLYPGQRIPIHINIYDDLGYLIPSVVQTTTFSDPFATARLGTTGIQLVDHSNTTSLLTITGRENHTFNVTLIELVSIISLNLTVELLPCSLGYVYDAATASCMCDGMLLEVGITCNMTNLEELVLPPNTWVGLLERVSDTSNPITTGDLVVSKCALAYCNGTNMSTGLPHGDSICAAGSMKTGVLCGACASNHSAVLGRYNICAKCGNVWLTLIPAFGIAGILLLVAIAFLQLTVDKGWMYVIIFYCNTVTLYAHLLPVLSPLHFVLIPAHLVSLQVGYEVCFYDGMTTLSHVWLQLAFPAYLYLLMGVFVLLSRRSSWLSQHFSPTQTLLTLFVMSYTSILETCVSSVYGIRLSTLSGHASSLRWQADAHVGYFSGSHAALVVLSTLLLLFYIIPLPIMMLFPMLAYKHTKRFKPFFDAMWAPFETKLRLWLGVRFLVLITIYLIAYNINKIGVLSFGFTLLIFNQLQTSIQPFKSKWINRIDGMLTMTIIVLIAMTYQPSAISEDRMSFKIRLALAYALFALAYVVVLLAALCTSVSRFSSVKKMRSQYLVLLRACGSEAKKRTRRSQNEDTTSQVEMSYVPAPPTTNSFRVQLYPKACTFSHLRETLLDSSYTAANK